MKTNLTNVNIGFIGMGNMARALVNGFLNYDAISPAQIYAMDVDQQALNHYCQKHKINACHHINQLIQQVDYIIVAVKPHVIESVISPLQEQLKDKVLISIALGWDFEQYEKILAPSTRHLFIMPNTPAESGEGTFLFEQRHSLTLEEYTFVTTLFSKIGKIFEIPSAHMSIAGTITGCSPAFFALILEAMGDGAVLLGLPREQAYQLVEQAMLGTAKLALETNIHPGVLKDAVCSPNGSTIQGIASLEENHIRSAFIQAIKAATITS